MKFVFLTKEIKRLTVAHPHVDPLLRVFAPLLVEQVLPPKKRTEQ